jgi:hypothetical protein
MFSCKWHSGSTSQNLLDVVSAVSTVEKRLRDPRKIGAGNDSAALLALALFLITANWFFFVTGVVLFCLLMIRTQTEEENLVARFGDSYRAYMERTGRFLPRIASNRRGI